MEILRSPAAAQILANQLGLVRAAPGDLKATATVDAPPGGWLPCNFSPYQVSDYPELALVLQKAGYEDAAYAGFTVPSGTFYTPDYRGLPMIGADPAGGAGYGAIPLTYYNGGNITLSVANLPAHTHPTSDGGNFLETAAGAANAATGAVRIAGTQYQPTTGSTGSGTAFRSARGAAANIWIKT